MLHRILLILVAALLFCTGDSVASHRESEPVCFAIVDLNSDQAVSWEEFADAFGDASREQFEQSDLDASGTISEDEYLLFIDRNHPL
ncbi:MAG: hypothetical protein ACOC24_02735 [Desulfovibrionales bacterium]